MILGTSGESKKGLEMSLISIVDVNANTAYALDAKQTIDDEKKSRAGFVCRSYRICF